MSLILAATESTLNLESQQVKTELIAKSEIEPKQGKSKVNSGWSNLIPATKETARARGKLGGRPKSRQFAEFVRDMYENNPDPRNIKRLIRLMEKRCPNELAHYLAGKPVTAIELSGPDKGKIEVQASSQEAVTSELSRRGLSIPGLS